jgi:serine/threonine-protein kinase
MTVQSPVSSVGQVVGTVPYMAPEQVRGEALDARADLFALGIILYELVAGRRPFGGTTPADVTSAILRDAPTPLASLRAELPRDLERIVARCLEKDRERRFQTAKDVRNELELVQREIASGSSSSPRAVSSTGSPPGAPVAAAPAREAPSIAVLPFVNRSRDADDEYFSDGLADELLNVLAKIRGLRVAARTSSSTFKGRQATIEEVGRALNVASVLEGSVRKSGTRVRISVQLVKVADGYHLWSETYDRTLDDIFAVQDDIAQAVVKELRTALLGEAPDSKGSGELKAEVASAAKGRGESTEAHRLYLQGRYLVDRLSREEVSRGIRCLLEAVTLDPGHALAWVCLSQAYGYEAGYGWAPMDEGYPRAIETVGRAIALEPDLPEAHSCLGRHRMNFLWDWAGADASYRRALELAPDSSDALRGAGALAQARGRYDEAIALSRRSVECDPLSMTAHVALGQALRGAGRAAEAEASFLKAIDLAPERIVVHLLLSLVLIDQGRAAEAIAAADREPAPWARLCALGIAHYAAGNRAEGDAALREMEEKFGGDSAYQIAAVHLARGDASASFEWLDRAYAQHDPGLVWVGSEPLFRPLHGDPRWRPFLGRMKIEP